MDSERCDKTQESRGLRNVGVCGFDFKDPGKAHVI